MRAPNEQRERGKGCSDSLVSLAFRLSHLWHSSSLHERHARYTVNANGKLRHPTARDLPNQAHRNLRMRGNLFKTVPFSRGEVARVVIATVHSSLVSFVSERERGKRGRGRTGLRWGRCARRSRSRRKSLRRRIDGRSSRRGCSCDCGRGCQVQLSFPHRPWGPGACASGYHRRTRESKRTQQPTRARTPHSNSRPTSPPLSTQSCRAWQVASVRRACGSLPCRLGA